MTEILKKVIESIEIESPDRYCQSFILVDALVKEYSEENLAERLYEELRYNSSKEVIAKLFCILIWSTSDNGSALMRTTDKWIESLSDEKKIWIALNVEAYPFESKQYMEEVLLKVQAKFPELLVFCEDLIKTRKE